MEIATLAYLDNELIDELWMLVKRDGIDVERVDTIKKTLEAKANVGLGRLLGWLVSDLKGELGARAGTEHVIKTTYAAPIRLMLLLELLPKVRRIRLEEHEVIAELRPGDFVYASCPMLALVPLPRIGDYWCVYLMDQVSSGTEDLTPGQGVESAVNTLNTYSNYHRAFSFLSRLQKDRAKSKEARPDFALARLEADYGETLSDMMSLSSDDLILGASLSLRPSDTNEPDGEQSTPIRDATPQDDHGASVFRT